MFGKSVIFFLPVFFSVTKNRQIALFYALAWPPSPFSVSLQGMSSGSDLDCQVIETKILSDERWLKSLGDKERQWLDSNTIPFDELEDRKVVCTSCFKQGNHKQRVSVYYFWCYSKIWVPKNFINVSFAQKFCRKTKLFNPTLSQVKSRYLT